MPEENFKVRIETEADTKGIQQTQADIAKLKQDAAATPAGPATAQAAEGAKGLAEGLGKALTGAQNIESVLLRLPGVIGIAAAAGFGLYRAITSYADGIKQAAEEHQKLLDQLDEHVRAYEKIRNVAQWDQENEKIEEQITKLQRKLALTTDGKEQEALKDQLKFLDLQKTTLDALAKLGIERAKREKEVAEEIRNQAKAVQGLADAYEAARRNAERTADTSKKIRDLQRDENGDEASEKRRRGEITSAQELAEKETARREAAAANHAAEQKALDDRKKSLQGEADSFKQGEDREKKILEGMEKEAVRREEAKQKREETDRNALKAEADLRKAREEQAKPLTGPEAAREVQQARRDKAVKDAEDRLSKAREEQQKAEQAARHPGERPGEFEENLKKQQANVENFDEQRRRAEEKLAKESPEIDAKKKANDEIYNETEKRERSRADRAIKNAQQEHDEKVADLKTEDEIQKLRSGGQDLAADKLKAAQDQRKAERDLQKEGLTQEEAARIAAERRSTAEAKNQKKFRDRQAEAAALQDKINEDQAKAAAGKGPGPSPEDLRRAQEIQRDLQSAQQQREPEPVRAQEPPQPGVPPEERPPQPPPQADTVKTPQDLQREREPIQGAP